ncbi:hypothetical protein [Microcystis sp. LE19-8.1F]|nr:hypothetical protein [Microcystis sp. LE19-8.1F]MCZ8212441.1 hypothetical protein [Microcystis sp. LE19-8.1F]
MTAGRYGDLIKKAREPENQNTSLKEQNTNFPESRNTGLPKNQKTN